MGAVIGGRCRSQPGGRLTALDADLVAGVPSGLRDGDCVVENAACTVAHTDLPSAPRWGRARPRCRSPGRSRTLPTSVTPGDATRLHRPAEQQRPTGLPVSGQRHGLVLNLETGLQVPMTPSRSSVRGLRASDGPPISAGSALFRLSGSSRDWDVSTGDVSAVRRRWVEPVCARRRRSLQRAPGPPMADYINDAGRPLETPPCLLPEASRRGRNRLLA